MKPIKDCPHLQDGKCNHPTSHFRGRAYLRCESVREIYLACALENEKNLTPKGGNTG